MKRMKRMRQKQKKTALKCKWYHPVLLSAALLILPAGVFLAGAGGSAWVSARSNESHQMENRQEIEKKSCIHQTWNGAGAENSSGEQMQKAPTGSGSTAGNQEASENGNSQNPQSGGSAQKPGCTGSDQSQSSGSQKDDTGAESTNTPGTEKPDRGDTDTERTGTAGSGTAGSGSTGSGITGTGTEEAGSAGTGTTGSETGKTDPSETEKENGSSGEAADPSCICAERCSQADREIACAVCRTNPEKCIGRRISVRISIIPPQGWKNRTAKVEIKVEDLKQNGTFRIAKVQAKIGQNGTWQDITDRMTVSVSENCTVYVQVTDQRDRLYEKNAVIQCFDRTKPTLNAAVNGGLLSVVGYDTESGIQAIYVNGYEFTHLTNGTLNIRLQKFDAGYQYFTMQAMDKAGNMSEVYRMSNPYYTDPSKKDSTTKDPAALLPSSGSPSKPGSAAGSVTEHIKTDTQGNQIITGQSPSGGSAYQTGTQNGTGTPGNSLWQGTGQPGTVGSGQTGTNGTGAVQSGTTAGGTAAIPDSGTGQKGTVSAGSTETAGTAAGTASENQTSSTVKTDPETGREFYTIQTASDKTFYLVIDRKGNSESVYFLTEVSENDLLNTLETNSQVLPMNSAVVEAAVPGGEQTLPGADSAVSGIPDTSGTGAAQTEMESESASENETDSTASENEKTSNKKALPSWLVIGGLSLLACAGAYYFRIVRRKNQTFLDDEEEEEDAFSSYEYETEEEDDLNTDFFRSDDPDEASDATESGKDMEESHQTRSWSAEAASAADDVHSDKTADSFSTEFSYGMEGDSDMMENETADIDADSSMTDDDFVFSDTDGWDDSSDTELPEDTDDFR